MATKGDRDQPAGQMFGSRKHELKLGKSFQEDNSCGFHTIRYDFKPASVDHSREAALDVGESNEVNITFPNVENKGSTVFGGSKKPYQKECVLIFDHRTGEFTLERLSCNIQVKRQRQEGTSKAQMAPRTQQTSSKSSPNPRSNSQVNKKKDTPIHSPASERKVERSPAPQPSPLAISEPSPAAPASVPSINDKDADSSDSYMSASDSDDDSGSSSSGSSSSDNDDDDGDRDTETKRTERTIVSSKFSPSQPSPASRLMNVSPQILTLSQDLQLSESGSDSDSD
ncbi:ELL-associated factor 2-like [Lytechinus pictus]|uniref:ELL-associated factor 2-like n=1 Tax=Lytechinus pictus TaxID=7653 RepID=UPI0030BA27F9